MSRPLDVFLVAGEQSGDQLGFKLMRALRGLTGGGVSFRGVGGNRMEAEGLTSLFPLEDIAVMGFAAVLGRLPLLHRRIRETADAVLAAPPDVLVIIDSPDFTHRVARRVRQSRPDLPVVDYVSPSVWAWRSGRAAKMRGYVDEVLGLLPFEPAAHRRLGGPACTYVGHPLIERLPELRPGKGERRPIGEAVDLLVMPGSRLSVVRRHMPLFGAVLTSLAAEFPDMRITIPAVPSLVNDIEALADPWPVAPEIAVGEEAKLAAMRRANVALAASGTATLELALSGVPMVGAYRVEPLAKLVTAFARVEAPYILLPNLILGKAAIPELVADRATVENIAAALRPLLSDTARRRAQEKALASLDERMSVEEAPSMLAARSVLRHAGSRTE